MSGAAEIKHSSNKMWLLFILTIGGMSCEQCSYERLHQQGRSSRDGVAGSVATNAGTGRGRSGLPLDGTLGLLFFAGLPGSGGDGGTGGGSPLAAEQETVPRGLKAALAVGANEGGLDDLFPPHGTGESGASRP